MIMQIVVRSLLNIYLKLDFMTEETKMNYLEKIEKIKVKSGTNILNGLKKV